MLISKLLICQQVMPDYNLHSYDFKTIIDLHVRLDDVE